MKKIKLRTVQTVDDYDALRPHVQMEGPDFSCLFTMWEAQEFARRFFRVTYKKSEKAVCITPEDLRRAYWDVYHREPSGSDEELWMLEEALFHGKISEDDVVSDPS